MTTDTVKDVRSIGTERGSPATVSQGGNSNAGSSPLALLVPLVNARRHVPHPTTPAMAVPSGSSTGPSLMSGLAWMLRRLADGPRAVPGGREWQAGRGSRSLLNWTGSGCRL